MSARVLAAEYVLPLRAWGPPSCELTQYLRRLSELLPVTVVDGSAQEVFDAAHRAWPFVRHVAPHPSRRCINGKVHGVLTGLDLASAPALVIADDDVRYEPDELRRCIDALAGADLVRPQNYFDPVPWHAAWDTGRSVLNRALGADFPGTLVVRTDTLRAAGGYDGDVLFENLELVRTVEAVGGTCVHRPDIYVRRLPPTTAHFARQRVRQAYDELARPSHLLVQLAIVPAVVALLRRRRPRTLAVVLGATVGVAELGRRRAGGRARFAPVVSLCAPAWLLERGVCAWLAVVRRATGGVPYAGRRVVRAANPPRVLRRRLSRAAADRAGWCRPP